MRRHLRWRPGYRIIRTIFPPVDLFEDLTADPADWEALASFEAKTNPRVADDVGNLALVPAGRRVHGPTASLAMGCFTHVSPDRTSRFSDGSFGIWYCGDRLEVALAETAHHFERFMRATNQPKGEADYRLLTCVVAGDLEPAPEDCLQPDNWSAGQAAGAAARRAGADGMLYRSVRYPAGEAAALFWPDCLTLPISQNQQFRYRWDGRQMTHYLPHGETAWTPWPIPGAVS